MPNDENSNKYLIGLSLLYLLGIVENKTISGKIKTLTDTDWNAIILKSMEHRVVSLLYYCLSSGNVDAPVPDHIIQKLRLFYFNNSFINTRKFLEFAEVLKSFDKENTQVIVLKGFAIGGLIYDNIALRPMDDIDLLVKSEDILRIDSILSELGWENKSKQMFSKDKRRVTGDITFSKGSIFIDLQTNLRLMPKLDPWKEVSFIKIDETNIPILKLDDFLLHLCLHLNKHIYAGFSELIRLYDIVEMLKKFGDSFDWKYIEDTAKINKSEDALYRILRILGDVPSIHLPFNIGKLNKNGLSLSIYDLLNIPQPKGKSVIKGALSICFNSEILPVKYKLRTILKLLFPNKSYMVERYTPNRPNLFYLYYPLRLVLGIIALKSIKGNGDR